MNQAVSYPSFSIVLETENLANAALEGLERSIRALAQQNPSPAQANEVLLIDSGDTPPQVLTTLCQQYPWITLHTAPPGITYYQAKMLGAEVATGEVIVYYDSDCLYTPDWMGKILAPFQDPQVQGVAGETTTGGRGPYGTAMALTYIFPQFSDDVELTPTCQYFLNNVAFRRKFLLQHPIPTDLPLYRGNCVIHAHRLQRAGQFLWRHPQARVVHAPPNGRSHFFWRFLLIGYDYYWQKRLLREETGSAPQATPQATVPPGPTAENTLGRWQDKWGVFGDRLQKMMRHHPQHGLYLPLALPIVLVAGLLILGGYWITAYHPKYLLETYRQAGGD